MMMMKEMQEVAPDQPEDNMMSSPSWAGTWWVPVAVAWAEPVGEACWKCELGLSDNLVAAEHPAESSG